MIRKGMVTDNIPGDHTLLADLAWPLSSQWMSHQLDMVPNTQPCCGYCQRGEMPHGMILGIEQQCLLNRATDAVCPSMEGTSTSSGVDSQLLIELQLHQDNFIIPEAGGWILCGPSHYPRDHCGQHPMRRHTYVLSCLCAATHDQATSDQS